MRNRSGRSSAASRRYASDGVRRRPWAQENHRLDLLHAGRVIPEHDCTGILVAVSDNGTEVRSDRTRTLVAALAVARQFGRPSTPTDQAWIESSELEALARESRDAVDRLRLLLFELPPLELNLDGLTTALSQLVLWSGQISPNCTFKLCTRIDREPLEAESRLILLVAREILSNVRIHSSATNCIVRLRSRRGRETWLSVLDDGIGFSGDPSTRIVPGHLGLARIRFEVEANNGQFDLRSTPGQGCVIEIRLPLHAPAAAGRGITGDSLAEA